MVRLNWLKREWNLASDDLVIPSTFFAWFLLLWLGLTSLAHVLQSEHIPNACTVRKQELLSFPIPENVAFYVLISKFIYFACVAFLSSLGSIRELKRRKWVPLILSVYIIFFTIDCVFLLSLILQKTQDRDASAGTVLQFHRLINIGVIIFTILPVIFIALHFRQHRTSPKGKKPYKHFLKLCEDRLPKNSESEVTESSVQALSELTQTFSDVFWDQGLAPSDVLAGFLLLRSSQRQTQESVKIDSSSAVENNKQIKEFYNHAKYFFAAYGLPLLPIGRIMRIILRRLISRIRRNQKYTMDSYCHAICEHLQCSRKEVLDYSAGDEVYQPAFYILSPHDDDVIIIAIRGTMSISDCITDLLCHGSPVQTSLTGTHSHTSSMQAHHGMLESAKYILDRIKSKGLMERFVHSSDLGHKRIVVLGHSLGAGVATILSILLHEIPCMRNRVKCLAYSPPGGLVNLPLAKATSSFVKAIYIDNDVVPRLSKESVEDLRTNVIEVLTRCKRNKASVLLYSNAAPSYFFDDPIFIGKVTKTDEKMYPPVSIIVLYKEEEERKSSCLWRYIYAIFWFCWALLRAVYMVVRVTCYIMLTPAFVLIKQAHDTFKSRKHPKAKANDAESVLIERCCPYQARSVDIEGSDTLDKIQITSSMFWDHLPGSVYRALESYSQSH